MTLLIFFLADLLKTLRPNGDAQSSKISDTVVSSYKKLIKQQDDTIAALTQELAALKQDVEGYESQLAQGYSLYEQLKNQFVAQTRELEYYKSQVINPHL